ncbi:hypothetical protein C6P10_10645 [Weissella confusa]|nr:hypothetical protein C6P10_10645 [Weissella confusa]
MVRLSKIRLSTTKKRVKLTLFISDQCRLYINLLEWKYFPTPKIIDPIIFVKRYFYIQWNYKFTVGGFYD